MANFTIKLILLSHLSFFHLRCSNQRSLFCLELLYSNLTFIQCSTILLIKMLQYYFQIKDMAERLPDGVKMGLPGANDSENVRPIYVPNGMEQNGAHHLASNGERHSESDSHSSLSLASSLATDYSIANGYQGPPNSSGELPATDETNSSLEQGRRTSDGMDDDPDVRLPYGYRGVWESSSSSMSEPANNSGPLLDTESSTRSRNSTLPGNDNQVEAEWIEQYEPGVYITLMALRDGTRDLKRVRFR